MDNLSKDNVAKIKRNIANMVRKDLDKYGRKGDFTYEDFIEKVNKQGNKCYVCLQEFKYDGGKWCHYFPSADRIYNYSPHDKNNIAIACTFCNIRMFNQFQNKKCGLCEGLNHIYEGKIITKSELFRHLGNVNWRIKEYINGMSEPKPGISILLESMSSNYTIRKGELERLIDTQKMIYTFRNFMYSLNKDIRYNYFIITRDYLENEYNHNTIIHDVEKDRLKLLLDHWQWDTFVSQSTAWWSELTTKYALCATLRLTLDLWTHELKVYTSASDCESIGLR